MIIRKLTEKERSELKKLLVYAFDPIRNNYENFEWPPDTRSMNTFYGAFDKEKLVSDAGIIPFEIRLRNTKFKMGGVDAVATKPEYRNRGIVRKMMGKIFEDLHENKIPISVLHPFKFSFYENLGYSLVDENIIYQFKISDIKTKNTNYHMEEVDTDFDDLKFVYKKVVEKFSYIAYRTESRWETHKKNNFKFICYDNKSNPVGYVILNFPRYSVWDEMEIITHPKDTMIIRETFWVNIKAKQTIFNFLWSHRDHRRYVAGIFPKSENIIDMLHSPRVIVRHVRANSMLRIIDVKRVLESITYSIKDFGFIIRVHDEQCPWNNQIFKVSSNHDGVSVNITNDNSLSIDIEINIKFLAQLIAGFRTVKELNENNNIIIENDKFEAFMALFPRTNNFFFDFF